MTVSRYLNAIILAAALLAGSHAAYAAEAQPLAQDPVVEKRLMSISENLRCLVCQNETLAASRADLAQDLRREVRELIVAGKSDKEIIDFLVARYGDYVLYDPPFKATTLLLWVGPFVVLAGGLAGLIIFLRRRSHQPAAVLVDKAEPVSIEPTSPSSARVSQGNKPRGRWLLVLLLVVIPVGALSVYYKVGLPQALNPANLQPRPDPEAMVARLAARLEAKPDDPQGWALLGRAYMVLNRPADAVKAYNHIIPELKKDPALTAAYAEALLADGDFPRARRWIDEAMQRGNKDPQIVFLAGGIAFSQGDNAKAIRDWEQVLKAFPAGSDEAKYVQENINQAKARMKK